MNREAHIKKLEVSFLDCCESIVSNMFILDAFGVEDILKTRIDKIFGPQAYERYLHLKEKYGNKG